MKKLIVFSCSLILIFLFIGQIVIGNLHASVVVIWMTKCEKTGRSILVYQPNGGGGIAPNAPPGSSYYIYEIEIEWYMAHFPDSVGMNLWRNDQPGAYPGGTRVARNIAPYDIDYYHDSLYGWIYDLYYRKFDWVPSGTWYYMAEYDGHGSGNELNETVP